MEVEREIGGIKYRIGRMDTFKQFHVARRLTPVLSGLLEALKAAGLDPAKLVKGEKPADIDPLAMVEPLGRVIGALSDADAEYILNACLDVCLRDQTPTGGSGWAKLRSGSVLMFQDISLPVMLQLAWAVVETNVSGFFSAAGQTSRGSTAQQ
jgi:hypothetical protein